MKLNSEQKKELLINTLRSESSLIINKVLIERIGLIPAVLLSNYLEKQLYFEKSHSENDGWFFHSHSHIQNQTGLTEWQIKETKKILVNENLLTIKRQGLPSKEWLKINYDELLNKLINSVNIMYKPPLHYDGEILCTTTEKSSAHINKSINNNKSIKRKRIYVATKVATDIPKNKNVKFVPISLELKQIVQSQKNINISTQKINSWANSIRLLVETDGVSLERVEKALNWYKEHYSDDYVPVIESGITFRKKFTRLEDAIERSTKPFKRSTQKSGFKKGKLNYKEPEIL